MTVRCLCCVSCDKAAVDVNPTQYINWRGEKSSGYLHKRYDQDQHEGRLTVSSLTFSGDSLANVTGATTKKYSRILPKRSVTLLSCKMTCCVSALASTGNGGATKFGSVKGQNITQYRITSTNLSFPCSPRRYFIELTSFI